MAKIQDIDLPYLEFAEASAPSTPASGIVRIYAKTDGSLYQKDDAGTETGLAGGGGGAVATDTIWDAAGDLAVGTGADTAARLAISATAGHLLKSNGTTATWAYPTFIGAKAYHSTTQNITDSTVAVALFNSEEYDTSSFHDTGSNTGRMTVPITGYYRLTGYVYFGNTADDTVITQFYKNGTTILRSQTTFKTPIPSGGSTSTAANVGMIATTTVSLTASDYVEVRVYNFGANATIGDASNTEQQNFFAIEFLGV